MSTLDERTPFSPTAILVRDVAERMKDDGTLGLGRVPVVSFELPPGWERPITPRGSEECKYAKSVIYLFPTLHLGLI